MNSNFTKYFQILKDNLTIIALIPTFLGGIWQLFQLGGISIQMIRFFSLTQLVNDGVLLILFLIFPVSILILILNTDFKSLYDESDFNLIQYLREKKKSYFFPFCIFTILMFFIMVLFTDENIFYSFYFISSFSTIFILIQILLLLLFFQFLRKNILLELYLGVTSLINIILCFIAFYLNFVNTETIENFSFLINDLEKKECYSKAPKIRYYNDKFLFIELEKKNKKSILIKKIDDLFAE